MKPVQAPEHPADIPADITPRPSAQEVLAGIFEEAIGRQHPRNRHEWRAAFAKAKKLSRKKKTP